MSIINYKEQSHHSLIVRCIEIKWVTQQEVELNSYPIDASILCRSCSQNKLNIILNFWCYVIKLCQNFKRTNIFPWLLKKWSTYLWYLDILWTLSSLFCNVLNFLICFWNPSKLLDLYFTKKCAKISWSFFLTYILETVENFTNSVETATAILTQRERHCD